jgi:hypothetical protein
MKRHILGARTIYFEMTLHVNIRFRVDSSPKVVEITYGHFKMNLHASIAYRPWSLFKGHPNYILLILK